MVLGYNYSKQKRWWRQTNVPLLLAILIAMGVCRSNTDGIAQCCICRATPEASGHCHWATTCSVLPRRPEAARATGKQTTINKYIYFHHKVTLRCSIDIGVMFKPCDCICIGLMYIPLIQAFLGQIFLKL